MSVARLVSARSAASSTFNLICRRWSSHLRSPTEGSTPLTVNFSSAGSSDPEGQPLTYLWTFGDGTTSTAANPSHTYTIAGPYQARLTVSDGVNSTLSTPLEHQRRHPAGRDHYLDSDRWNDLQGGRCHHLQRRQRPTRRTAHFPPAPTHGISISSMEGMCTQVSSKPV